MKSVPLAEALRPTSWEQMQNLESVEPALLEVLKRGAGAPPSLILWGPPGSGKTTLARMIGTTFKLPFRQLSAVLSGVKDLRDIVAEAQGSGSTFIVFIDEIHRFNRAQQDALLPHVEAGTLCLIGATTENPSFAVTGALLSRCRVVVLGAHTHDSLGAIIANAAKVKSLSVTDEARDLLITYSAGDARRLLQALESVMSGAPASLNAESVKRTFSRARELTYDRSGEEHYNVVSAFIKSLRGSNADAALYWGFRMIEAGEDPRFVIRRMIIFASEDIGNADPRALQLSVATADAFERLGLPEGKIPIAHCITYLATAPKSNRSYRAMHAAIDAVRRTPHTDVPKHLRNAPTKLMKDLGYGSEYQYPHDTADAYVSGVQYLPSNVNGDPFYEPSDRGYEKTISERLQFLKLKVRQAG